MDNLSCYITPIQLFSCHEISSFSWIKSSSQQDTLVGKQKDGPISVLKIKENGIISRFVLDPNLVCAFWDDDDLRLNCQRLFAQAKNGNIVIYTVDSEGVTEIMQILVSKLISLIDPAHYGISTDAPVSLVACEQSHIVLNFDARIIASVQVTSLGSLLSGCILQLPSNLPGGAEKERQDFDSFQVVNGVICIFCHHKNVLSMYSISSGECSCTIDLSPVNLKLEDLLCWKMSYDHSSVMIVKKTFHIHRIPISSYAQENPQAVVMIDKSGREKAFNHEYFSYHLCRFGDSLWKKEITGYHIMAAQGKFNKDVKKDINGFVISRKRNSRSRSSTQSARNLPCQFMDLATLKEERWTISEFEVTSDVLTMLFRRKGIRNDEKVLVFANFRKDSFFVHRLEESSCVIVSTKPPSVNVILSESNIKYVTSDPDIKKDDLISGMMVYSGPHAADNLCQVNQWTRTAIPLNALETSLQQRQLDTLAFFFKSKEGLFTSMKQNGRLAHLASEIHHLEGALNLVGDVIDVGVKESQARLFAQRLLTLSLDFLYALFEDARNCLPKRSDNNEPLVMDKEIQESCEKLHRHVSSLRKFMQRFKYRGSSSQYSSREGSVQGVPIPKDEIDAGSNVQVEKYIKDNKLTLLQSSIMDKGSDGSSTYKKLLLRVLRNVQKHLQDRDVISCQQILTNLGCDVKQALWNLSQFYSDRSLQEFITSQLLGAVGLTQVQHSIVELMTQLYKVYSNGSFRSALKIKNKHPSNSWSQKDDLLKEMIPAVDVFLPSHFTGFDDSAGGSGDESVGHLYSSVLLAWLNQWSEDLKHSVFIDAKFLSSDNSSDALTILKDDPEGTWKFLIAHNMIDTLQSLMKKTSSDEGFQLPGDPLASLHFGSSYLQKELLRQLLRQGKLPVSSAKDRNVDINALLPIVGGPMKTPHVLAYIGTPALIKFHQAFIVNCVTHGLMLPLWIYCTIHGIDIEKLTLNHKTSWFSSFQLIHAIPKQPKEKSLMVAASKMAAGDLWSSPSEPMSIEAMLNDGHAMAAMATLSYMSQCDEVLDVALVQKYLNQFPKLILALMPEDNPTSKPVTTVYELLMGNIPLNLRRLFGWHGTNPYAGEDSLTVLPHFSEPTMTALRPCRRKLAFPFYLSQGRPVYAFQAFMCEELDRRDLPVCEKRIHQACGVALWLACKHFNTSYITSACVVFVELLGQDSALVRSMVHAGCLMLASRSRNSMEEDKKKSQEDKKRLQDEKQKVIEGISTELQACVKGRHHHSLKFIATLQGVVTELIDREALDRTSYEASQKWLLVIMLCQLLHLPLSTTFLEACAKSDNWFMFVWFAQLHQYPTHQLLSLLHHFQSPCYRDHLHYVVYNAENKLFSPPPQSSSASSGSLGSPISKGASMGQRTSLYQRIGVTKETVRSSSEESDDEKQGKSDVVMSSFSSRIRHAEFHESEMPESTAPDDVFRLLFYSQSMPCQWQCLLAACVSLRNPLFAELAASCGCPPVSSVCGWLLASLDNSSKQMFLNQHGHMVSRWRLDHLEALIEVVLSCGFEDALATAFTILQPTSPLTSFFCFVHECLKKGKYSSTKTYLNQFKDVLASFEMKSAKDSPSEKDVTTVGDRAWIEKVIYEVLCFYLTHVKSVYEAYHYLGILDTNNIALVFGFDVLNFSLLYQVVEIIHDNEIPNCNLVPLLTSGTNSETFASECQVAINYLIQQGKFEQAMQLSEITKINREKVALGQLRAEKEQLLQCKVWTSKHVRIQYWERACKLLQEVSCSLEAFEYFFKEELNGTSIAYEKALLSQHLLSLLDKIEEEDSDLELRQENVFRDMWKYRIASQMSIDDQEPLDRIFNDEMVKSKKEEYLKSDIAHTNIDSQTHKDTQEDLTSEEIEVLDSLIGNFLDKGKVGACNKVAAVFGHYNQDLTIIQTCISLASGERSLDRIEPAMKRLVAKTTQKSSQWMKQKSFSRSRSLSTSSFDYVSMSGEIEIPSKIEENYKLMENLYGHCLRGRQVCLRIVTCYRIAEIIDSSYQDVIFDMEFDILQKILKTEHPEKFLLARDFLTTSGLSDDEVTVFLADSIVEMLKKVVQVEDISDDFQVERQKQPFVASEGLEFFGHYLKLCGNTSLLGDRILQAVASFLSDDDGELSANVLTIQTEMIIMAHECYTTASNMEGISHVLRAARVLTNCLAQAGEFNLMIRLLLGVGRYSEMMYIFHALQQNHQFELLLRKGMDREDKLKVAILDYLKRYQPDDNEAYTMVALKFTMFRDIAAMLEKCGHKALKTLKNKKPLENSKDTQEVLRKCLQYFKDAAESYVKDASVRKAQRCVRFARLISLQLHLLSNGTTVIHLSSEEVTSFLNTHTRFIEAMVVSEAYERHANWAEAVYNNVIMGGEKSYLQEMQLHVHLTSALIEDVVKIYRKSAIKPSGAMTGIRKLLSHCKDAQLQYKLASELGLTDIVTSMLKSDAGSYLQDVSVV